ncbi:hypothetical protein KOW79_002962 [Hemibagrus wyckioides]|uniref:Uncharacterized protein n=1 Tax=Hemibagrus wyckioides TaxID=337641 RepID=A0A9D3P4I2_9TELE|nr:hypothetical protein KOW79_002962 [Hemibagrus wyckioides]
MVASWKEQRNMGLQLMQEKDNILEQLREEKKVMAKRIQELEKENEKHRPRAWPYRDPDDGVWRVPVAALCPSRSTPL